MNNRVKTKICKCLFSVSIHCLNKAIEAQEMKFTAFIITRFQHSQVVISVRLLNFQFNIEKYFIFVHAVVAC